jgi:hypothetical protein
MELKRSTTAFEDGKSGDDVHTLIARGSRGDLHFPQKKEKVRQPTISWAQVSKARNQNRQ